MSSDSKPSKTTLVLPILLITFGIGWLLTYLDVAPEIDWTWTLGLAVAGLLLFVVLGVDKVTLVCAPLLLVASLLSIFQQMEILSLGVFVPILVILTGALLLLARNPKVPTPNWIVDSGRKGGDS